MNERDLVVLSTRMMTVIEYLVIQRLGCRTDSLGIPQVRQRGTLFFMSLYAAIRLIERIVLYGRRLVADE